MATARGSLSVAVVEAIADTENVDPVDLPSPLADTVDPEALDVLFQNGTGSVSFDYCGYEVTATANGTVEVTPLKE